MKQAISDTKKRGRGRPRVGSTAVMVRIPPELLADLDRWRAETAKAMREEPEGRPEAIRSALEYVLDSHRPKWALEDARAAKKKHKG